MTDMKSLINQLPLQDETKKMMVSFFDSLEGEPPTVKTCKKCNTVYLGFSNTQMDLLDSMLPGAKDFKDVDDMCGKCTEEKYPSSDKMQYMEIKNFYCPNCLKTKRFSELPDFWKCETCSKKLWKKEVIAREQEAARIQKILRREIRKGKQTGG